MVDPRYIVVGWAWSSKVGKTVQKWHNSPQHKFSSNEGRFRNVLWGGQKHFPGYSQTRSYFTRHRVFSSCTHPGRDIVLFRIWSFIISKWGTVQKRFLRCPGTRSRTPQIRNSNFNRRDKSFRYHFDYLRWSGSSYRFISVRGSTIPI